MNDKIRELMGHIDYFFNNIPSLYKTDVEFEVYLKDSRWTITDKSDGQIFGTTDYNGALNHLIEVKADLEMLHKLVHNTVSTEGVLRKMQLKKCTELVGIEAIDKHMEAWEKFSDNLCDIVKKEIGSEDNPGLILVED